MVRQSFLSLWIAIALLLVSTASVSAQEKQPYTSTLGYSIQAPEGWEPVSGELDDKEFKKLPDDIRKNYNPKSTDVMFMDLSSGSTKKEVFKDNLNIVVLDEFVTVNAELSKELEKILVDQYTNLFVNFKLTTFESRKFGVHDAIHIQATYELLDYKLSLYQALISNDKSTLVLTCTIEESRKEERAKACEEAFKSVTFPSPEDSASGTNNP